MRGGGKDAGKEDEEVRKWKREGTCERVGHACCSHII